MATLRSVVFNLKSFNKWNFYSCPKKSVCTSHLNSFRASEIVLNTPPPIKYTTSRASQLNFPNVNPDRDDDVWYKNYVILGSISVFCLYFLCLREENDIDEMLKAAPEDQEGVNKLFHLQMKLFYCEQNKLPTKKLREEIKLLKQELNIKDVD